MTGITVLGAVAVQDEGSSLSPRDRVVLCVLVARRGLEVPVDTLAEALWGEDPPASSAKIVQGCVARLRRRLGPDAITTGRGRYRLSSPEENVDAARFERLAQRGRDLLALDHYDQAAYAVDEALDLWHGRPFPDLEDWEPGRGEADRLTELRLQAEELRLGALLGAGRHAEALPEATLRVQQEPLREHRWALLARAQYQDGRQAEALATMRRARKVLADELGLDPGRELTELEQAIFQQDPGLSVPPAGTSAAACPWPGLAAYDVDDSDSFFGRDAELAEVSDRLGRTGFLAVVGPSGSGKSSLVRAGLAARLRREGHGVHIITPDPGPLEALARAAAGSGHRPVLVVDQCEEIFSPAVPERVRAEFLAGVAAQVDRGPVVLTLRADKVGELTAYPVLARLVESGLYLLTGFDAEGVREAIEGPARRAGLLLEQGLVDLLVRDVEGEPGSLPLLSHALRQTWERREGSTLTVGGYRASGGIHGAVAQSAEQVYEEADEEQRHALRELLLRMVQPGPAGDPVPTSVAREMVVGDERSGLVERLVRARLITAAADRLEIAHEALARAWPRLQGWLAEDVEGERIRHHLAAAAEAWRAMGRPASELYRGARLVAAREWLANGAHRLGGVEEEFLAASETAHQSRLARAEDEARRQRRLNRRLRLLVAGVTVLALLATVVGAVARGQWREARDAQARARAHELSASAVVEVDRDPALARTLSVVAAQEGPPSLQVSTALHRAHAADPVVSRLSMNHLTHRLWSVLHPDGTRVAMSGESAVDPALALEVHDALTGELVWEWARPEEAGHESAFVAGAAYTADGSVLASGVVWNPHASSRYGPPVGRAQDPPPGLLGVHLWDAATHAPLEVLDVGPCGGWPLEITDDVVLVRTLLPSTDPARASEREHPVLRRCEWWDGGWGNYLVDRSTGQMRLLGVTSPVHLQWQLGATLSGDGTVAALVEQRADRWTLGDREDVDATVLLDVETGAELGRVRASYPTALDATGERVLVINRADDVSNRAPDATLRVVSVDDGRTLATFTGHRGIATYGTFSADGSTVLSAGLDNVVHEWDAATGQEGRRLPGTGDGRPSLAKERWVLVPRSMTGGAVLVDTQAGGEGWAIPACGGSGDPGQLAVGGDRILAGRDCEAAPGRLDVLDRHGEVLTHVPDAVRSETLALSPDGTRVVGQTGTDPDGPGAPVLGALEVRSVRTGEVVQTLEGFCEHLRGDPSGCFVLPSTPFAAQATSLLWSPDGRLVVMLDWYSGHVAVWNAASGELLAPGRSRAPVRQGTGGPFGMIFSPDSARLVIGTTDARLVALDTTTWDLVASSPLPSLSDFSAVPVGYAADGSLVVVSPMRQNVSSTSVMLADPDTLEVRKVFSGVVDGAVRSADLSPDGTRLALAAGEGFVGVWELAGGALVDRADPGLGSLEAVRWLDEHDLVVLSRSGALVTLTTDPDRLLDLVRGRVTRGLRTSECTAYGIDPCPDVGSLVGGEPTVPEELRGTTYQQSWTARELEDALVDHHETVSGTGLDGSSLDRLAAFAADVAGDYRLTFTDHGYAITDGTGEEWCVGGVTRPDGRSDRLLLGADRGSRCSDFHYAEVGWELDGDELRLPPDSYRGDPLEAIAWTSRPWERAG